MSKQNIHYAYKFIAEHQLLQTFYRLKFIKYVFKHIFPHPLYLTETQHNDNDVKKQSQNQGKPSSKSYAIRTTHIAREHVGNRMLPRYIFCRLVTLPTSSAAIRNLRGSAGWVGLEWCKPHRSDYALSIRPHRKPSFCPIGRRHTSSNYFYSKTG